MRLQVFFVLPFLLSCRGIKVPIDRSSEVTDDETPTPVDPTQNTPTYYVNNEEDGNIDSYLIPPSPHQPEVLVSDIATPATYLLPPSPDKQTDFYYDRSDPGEQSDWYPIAQAAPSPIPQSQAIYQNHDQSASNPSDQHNRKSKSHDSSIVPVPATSLQPPLENAPQDYFVPPSAEEIPLENIQRPTNVPKLIRLEEIQRPLIPKVTRYELPIVIQNNDYPVNYRQKQIEPTLALHLIPPQPENYKVPTKLYPKKFGGDFKPVPIPIAQYLDESALQIPRAKPAKLFRPLPSTEIDYLTPSDEKINYLYRKAEHKQKLKGEQLSQEQSPEVSAEETYSLYNDPVSTEQEASESNFKHPGRNVYPAPLRQPAPSAPVPSPHHTAGSAAPDERTEFRMHGMKGPHSYQFGFDTGKGKNRQFRYEERDNDGKVQGHYGYMDKRGKLRVVNYTADPKTGFHAEAPVDKE